MRSVRSSGKSPPATVAALQAAPFNECLKVLNSMIGLEAEAPLVISYPAESEAWVTSLFNELGKAVDMPHIEHCPFIFHSAQKKLIEGFQEALKEAEKKLELPADPWGKLLAFLSRHSSLHRCYKRNPDGDKVADLSSPSNTNGLLFYERRGVQNRMLVYSPTALPAGSTLRLRTQIKIAQRSAQYQKEEPTEDNKAVLKPLIPL